LPEARAPAVESICVRLSAIVPITAYRLNQTCCRIEYCPSSQQGYGQPRHECQWLPRELEKRSDQHSTAHVFYTRQHCCKTAPSSLLEGVARTTVLCHGRKWDIVPAANSTRRDLRSDHLFHSTTRSWRPNRALAIFTRDEVLSFRVEKSARDLCRFRQAREAPVVSVKLAEHGRKVGRGIGSNLTI
jgi:hypothetical protein